MIQILDKPKTKKTFNRKTWPTTQCWPFPHWTTELSPNNWGFQHRIHLLDWFPFPTTKRIWTVVECYGTCTIIISIWLHVTHVLLRSFARLAIGWGTLRMLWFINSNDSLFKSSTPNQEKTHANRKITIILKTYNSNHQRHFPEKYYLEPQISLKIRCV